MLHTSYKPNVLVDGNEPYIFKPIKLGTWDLQIKCDLHGLYGLQKPHNAFRISNEMSIF